MGIHSRNIFDYWMNCETHPTLLYRKTRLTLSVPVDLRLLHCPRSRIFPDVPWYFLEPCLATCVSPRTREFSSQRALEYTIVQLVLSEKLGFYPFFGFRRDEVCVALKKYMRKACSEVCAVDRGMSRRFWYVYILTTRTIQLDWRGMRIVRKSYGQQRLHSAKNTMALTKMSLQKLFSLSLSALQNNRLLIPFFAVPGM
jgi:hypothetical protein